MQNPWNTKRSFKCLNNENNITYNRSYATLVSNHFYLAQSDSRIIFMKTTKIPVYEHIALSVYKNICLEYIS